MKNKSISKNAFLNIIRVLLSIIFPLITYPYASRIIGVDNIGKVQFGNSLIIFISLIAALGINIYATREGAIVRNDRKKFEKLASELFSINIITTLLAYILLFLILFLFKKFNNYRWLIAIQSISIILTSIGVEWVFQVYEDYFYITIRSIIVHVLAIILLFLFVRNENDYYIYSLITIFSGSGAYLFNIFYVRKYCNLKFIINKQIIKKHIKNLLILFSNSIAIQIYINSDLLMLGLMTTDYNVGIYGAAVRIYSIIKTLLNAVITVIIPRLTYLSTNNSKDEYQRIICNVIEFCFLFVLPCLIGLFILSKEIILVIFGNKFYESILILKVLSFALIFAVFSNLFANAILITNKKEKYVLISTVIAAAINVILNLFLIPKYFELGAAMTTLIAEITVMLICMYNSRNLIKFVNLFKQIIIATIECISIVVIYSVIINSCNNNVLIIMLTLIFSVFIYILILLIFYNKQVIYFLKTKFHLQK